ncbi:MAG: hypothetical protein ACRDQX_08035 [Pseudonocardiaceae bacterium]
MVLQRGGRRGMDALGLFPAALGLGGPWRVTRGEFDAEATGLDLGVDLQRNRNARLAGSGRLEWVRRGGVARVAHVATSSPWWGRTRSGRSTPPRSVGRWRGCPRPTGAATRARLAEVYDLNRGAVLVRPDGHVGWRCTDPPPDPGAAIAAAILDVAGYQSDRQVRDIVPVHPGGDGHDRPVAHETQHDDQQ